MAANGAYHWNVLKSTIESTARGYKLQQYYMNARFSHTKYWWSIYLYLYTTYLFKGLTCFWKFRSLRAFNSIKALFLMSSAMDPGRFSSSWIRFKILVWILQKSNWKIQTSVEVVAVVGVVRAVAVVVGIVAVEVVIIVVVLELNARKVQCSVPLSHKKFKPVHKD